MKTLEHENIIAASNIEHSLPFSFTGNMKALAVGSCCSRKSIVDGKIIEERISSTNRKKWRRE